MTSTDHITLEPHAKRVIVRFADTVIADSRSAVLLREGRLPPRLYIPRADVVMEHLVSTDHRTHCPYKGDASYFTIKVGDATAPNAVWAYPKPIASVEGIADLVSFYPDHVQIEELD